MASILLIDDEKDLTDFIGPALQKQGHVVECLDQPEDGPGLLASGRFDVVLLDNIMPRMTGIEFLQALRDRGIEVPVILMTAHSTADTAIQATKLGAFDYVIKPDDFQSLFHALTPLIREALEITRPVKEVRVAPAAPPGSPVGPTLVAGKSRLMVEVCKLIARFATTEDAVLIRGETGTGKELVARALHSNGPRKNKPFVALNCSAFTETLLEDELFGHEKGAYTGAEKLRKGKIEYADGGTLFLDEIGDMPLPFQAKLLRVLEYQEVVRLNSNEPIKVNVRLVSATHRDLEAAIREGTFRQDLFFRLNRVTLPLPALRERVDDLPKLVDYFLDRAAEATSRTRPGVAPATLERLRAHLWPGNVRELQNVIFRGFGVCRGPLLLPSHLDFPAATSEKSAPTAEADAVAGLRKAIDWAWGTQPGDVWPQLQKRLEEELIRFALDRCGGNQSEVAKLIHVGRTTLVERMKEYGLLKKRRDEVDDASGRS